MEKIKNTTELNHSLEVDYQLITNNNHITKHQLEHFKHLFNNAFVLHNSFMEELISNMVYEQTNDLLTIMPMTEEIQNVVLI